ncbi:helix-hairpin-helix domain-containing protein [Myceligenerans crystallogenes]|uniref:Helix-hairpin-helix DNA-binding motif class 1 domain-containing protein n=1 Tax=Myceligenerans crystallogenes TaxID=316335 RepID=A0ABP4ZS49_9MICO
MGWFITQSLLFIIIAAVVFFLLGLWVGWILWARRSKAAGRHTAETSEKRTTTGTAAEAAPATAGETTTSSPADADATVAADAAETSTPAPVAALAVPSGDSTTAEAGTEAGTAAVATLTEEKDGDDVTGGASAGDDGTDGDAPVTASDAAPGGAGVDTADAADIEDENLALYAGAEKDVVAEAEAATRDAAAVEDGTPETDATDAGTAADGAPAPDAATAGTAALAGTGAAAAVVSGTGETAPEAVPEAAAGAVASEAAEDDLTRIEGVGPKIAKALEAAGYGTYEKVAAASEDDIRAALTASGIKFAPAASSFAAQAQYLAEGDEKGLAEYQDYLIAGRDRKSAEFVEEVDYTDVDEVEGEAAKEAALEADAEKVAEATGEDTDAASQETAVATDTAAATPSDDDLKVIEGIGPKIEKALKADGITSYAQVAGMDEAALRETIAKSGIKFAPSISSWAAQAEYLVNGDDDGLKEYQDYLIGGQDRGRTKFVDEVDYTDVDEIESEAAKQAALEADAKKVAEAEAEGGQA